MANKNNETDYSSLDIVTKKDFLRNCQSLSVAGAVLGCLIKSPSLLTKYHLNIDDFVEPAHKILFGAIVNLFRKNIRTLSPYIIYEYLKENNPVQYEIIENRDKMGGVHYIQSKLEFAELDNFEADYNTLKKWALLRELKKVGFDISEFYVPEEEETMIEKENLRKIRFESESLESISAYFKNKAYAATEKFNDRTGRDSRKAGTNSIAQLEEWKAVQDIGYGYACDLLTKAAYGIRPKRFTICSAGSGVGKAISNTFPIPTPSGWKTVGDIVAGDYIFGDDGNPVQVLQIHPQEEQKQIWRIVFEDNRIIECCSEHLWKYCRGNNEKIWDVEDTKAIYDRYCELKSHKDSFFRIPVSSPVEYDEKSFGCDLTEFGKDITNGDISDEDFIAKYSSLGLTERKIPQDFFIGSIEQRKLLLKGIISNLGVYDKHTGETKIVCINKPLSIQVGELCHTLGIVAEVSKEKLHLNPWFIHDYIKKHGSFPHHKHFVISLKCYKAMKQELFDLFRVEGPEFDGLLAIKEIFPTVEFTDMTCFTVDNDSHLFLVGDYIVTHNTRICISNICHSFIPKYYDLKTNKWEPTLCGKHGKVLYIGTEMELLKEIEPIIWSYMSAVPEEHIIMNKYAPGEEARVREAIRILDEESNVYLEYIPDYDIATLENVIEQHVIQHGITTVFFDYIHTTTDLISEYQSKANARMTLREDQVLSNLSLKLKELTRKFNISIDAATQVTGDAGRKDAPKDASIIRGAKAIADKADVGYIISRVTEAELQKLEPYWRDSFGNKPNICFSIYKNRGSRFNMVKLWVNIDYDTMRVHDCFATDYDGILNTELKKGLYVTVNDSGKIKSYDTKEEAQYAYDNGFDEDGVNINDIKEDSQVAAIESKPLENEEIYNLNNINQQNLQESQEPKKNTRKATKSKKQKEKDIDEDQVTFEGMVVDNSDLIENEEELENNNYSEADYEEYTQIDVNDGQFDLENSNNIYEDRQRQMLKEKKENYIKNSAETKKLEEQKQTIYEKYQDDDDDGVDW